MRHAPPYVRCNAVYYGPLDLRGGSFGIDPGLAAEFSAITYLQESGGRIAPMLIAKAGRDQFSAINTSIDAFARAARELGAPVRVLVHPTGQHAFDVGDRGARSRTIIRETLTFFRNRLRQP